ncbi:PaaI family thioesterase [Histidinibacterium lentulum]|uniref:PaaI family thioesterase n=1 Tax=Histidinibacterium lentulum TaxID=2480588 RepID=A0A3N2R8R5_9RHOB|nr:PaaI family thioesterase [Histidinibacterium lentulum]ROU03825.1 PaaI family thioesterase [Histidinibacterium lentulum]
MESTDPDLRARRIAEAFVRAIPHAGLLGMVMREAGPGRAVIAMAYDTRLIGDPATGVIHGGAVSTLMDTCGGAAVLTHPEAPLSTATLDLRIDYMRAAAPGQGIVAEAECYHMTRSVAFVRAEARQEDGVRIAAATGAFTVERGT